MRILIGIPFLHPAIGYGSSSRAAYRLAEALQRLGHEVTVLTTDVWNARSRFPGNGCAATAPFRVIRVPNLSNKIAYRFHFYSPLGILKYAERELVRSDILHLHTFRNLHNDFLARLAERQGIPYVLTAHGTIPRIERFLAIKWLYDILLGRWQLQNAAGYVAVTEAEQLRMEKWGIGKNRIQVISGGVDDPTPVRQGAFRKSMQIPDNEKVILYLGRIRKGKGIQHLVRALALLSGRVRLVIGGADAGYAGRLKKEVADAGLAARVLWPGHLDDRRKYEAFADADVTVCPSPDRVFAQVALESLSAGTPVVVCDRDGCAEVVRSVGGGSLVSPDDPKALAEAVDRQLSGGRDRDEMAARAARVRSLYNWNDVAARTVQFYLAASATA
jgi:glycosyltransferase involved in cell wall biosynthesis